MSSSWASASSTSPRALRGTACLRRALLLGLRAVRGRDHPRHRRAGQRLDLACGHVRRDPVHRPDAAAPSCARGRLRLELRLEFHQQHRQHGHRGLDDLASHEDDEPLAPARPVGTGRQPRLAGGARGHGAGADPRAGGGARRRRGGEPGQDGLPREHEPRDQDPSPRDARHGGPGPGGRPRAGSAWPSRGGGRVGEPPDGDQSRTACGSGRSWPTSWATGSGSRIAERCGWSRR